MRQQKACIMGLLVVGKKTPPLEEGFKEEGSILPGNLKKTETNRYGPLRAKATCSKA